MHYLNRPLNHFTSVLTPCNLILKNVRICILHVFYASYSCIELSFVMTKRLG